MTVTEPSPEGPTTESPDFPAPRKGLEYRWVAMGVVLVGTFMVVLDTTIVNLALSTLRDDFASGTATEWIVTAYLVSVGVSQATTAWVGDKLGRRRAFVLALSIFTVGSLLCAVAPSLVLLVAARVVQGVGGGLLIPIAMAMIYELFEPHERGRAMGIFGIAVMAAPAIGPVLGGSIVSSVGWRWLFLVNVPIGLIGIPLALRLLRDTGYRENRPLDSVGLALVGTGIVSLLVGTQQGGEWGWSNPAVVALLLTGVVLLAAFTRHALRSRYPLVEMRLFSQPVFAVSMVALCLATIGQFCRLVYVPLELGTTRDIDELTIGLVMFPSAIAMALMMPIGGKLTDLVGSRIPFALGIGILAATFWPLAHLTPDTSLLTITAILFVGGLGSGLSMMAPNVVAMNSVHAPQVAQASGLSSVTRQLAAALGTAALASIFAGAVPDVADLSAPGVVTDAVGAYNKVFFVTFFVLLATVVWAALFLPGKQKALEMQEDRRLESEAAKADELRTQAGSAPDTANGSPADTSPDEPAQESAPRHPVDIVH